MIVMNIKLTFCLIILLVLSTANYGQENTQDSLELTLAKQENDTSKVLDLLKISRKYGRTNKAFSLKLCDQAEQLSKDLNFGKGIAGSWFERGIIYMKTGNLDTAILFNQKSIIINDSLQIKGQLAHNYNLMGIILLNKNEQEQALEYFTKAKVLFHQLHDSTGIIFISNSLGSLHETLGNYDSAAFYFFNFIKLCEKTGQEAQLGVGLVNIANIYMLNQDYEKAKEYAQRSISLSQEFDRPDLEVNAYKYLAIIHTKELKFEEALRYFLLATELAEKINDQSELSSIYINLGNFYDDQKQYDKALEYYNKSASIAKITGDIDVLSSSFLHKGLIYERKGNANLALIYYDSVINILEGEGYYNELSSVYYNIYKIYETKQDYKNAFNYQSKYYSLKDSALNIESKKAIAGMTLKYEKEKDQAKILNLENINLQKDLTLRKRTNQKNMIFFSGLGLILIAVFILIFIRYKARKEKIIAEQKIVQLEEEKKLLAASSIVNGQEEERKRIATELHDGLGVLLSTVKMQFSSLKSKIPENQSLIEKATNLLEQATGDVRRISHNMMPGLLTKLGFFEALADLFEQMNESGKIKADLSVEGNISSRMPENLEIMLYRIIQEMVNNSVKHADANTISLIINLLPTHISIQFSDDGKGFNVDEMLKLKTIGLKSILSRIKFLNGDVTIESNPGKGSTFFMQVPVVKK